MSTGSRQALVTLAVVFMLAPIVTVHPAVAHVYAAGLSNLSIEVEHPRVFGFVTLAAVSALPAAGFLYSLFQAALRIGHLRGLGRMSRPASLDGLDYRVLPSEAIAIFTAGFLWPRAFVSEGAERSLGRAQLRAALLHEQAHQCNRDVIWRLLLHAVGRGFGFLPWVARAVETAALRSECEADDYAIRAGACRRELFDAIAAAAAPPGAPLAAALTGTNVELRLTRLVHPDTPLPAQPTGRFLVLALAVITPAAVAHVIALVATVCTSRLAI